MLEGPFNLKVAKSIRANGVFCYKTADRYQAGIPDIYVAGGNWIEGKVIKCGNQNRSIAVFDRLLESQVNFAKAAIEAGDRVVVCVRFETPNSKHILIVPYRKLVIYPDMTVQQIKNLPRIKSEKRYDISIFSKSHERNLDMDWYGEDKE